MEESEAKDTMEQVAIRIMNKHNFIEMVNGTFGAVVLKDGTLVRILHNFEIVSENWKLFSKAIAMKNTKMINEILTVNTDGGIIDTGDALINIKDIKVMYPIYRINKNTDEQLSEQLKKEQDIEDFFMGNFEPDE